MSSVIALAAARHGECKFRAALTLDVCFIADLVLSKRFMPSGTGIILTQTPLLYRFPRLRMRQIEPQEA